MIMRMALLFLIVGSMPLSAFSFKDLFFKDYSKKAPQDTVTDLQNQQVNHPNDPKINYNLGVALYKTGDFAGARENFKRALSFGKDTLALRERCYFNLGNTDYQQTLQLLGYDWESKKIEPQVLGEATKTITEAIGNYKNVLVLNKEDEKAEKNKAVADELLKKLKKKQAEQQNNDKNKDKDNKKDKDSKDKDSENKDAEQGSNKDKNQKDDNDKKDQNKKDQKNKDNQNNDKKDGEQEEKDQQKNDQDKEKQDRKPEDKKESSGQDKEKEQKEDSKNQQGKDNDKDQKEQQADQEKKDKEQQSAPEKKPEEEKKIPSSQQPQPAKQQEMKPESFEKRQAKAVLDSLEQQEANLQKALIFRNVHNRQQRQTTNQRPW